MEQGSFEFLSDPEYFQVLEVTGCTDEDACNYSAAANTSDDSCVYPNHELQCQEDLTFTLAEGELSMAVDYDMPLITGGCVVEPFLPLFPEFELLPQHVEDNYMTWLTAFSNYEIWQYDGDFNEQDYQFEINDGIDDMYDGANEISTSFDSEISYTSGEIFSNLSFGEGSQYFTQQLPGFFFLAAEPNGIESFTIDGNLGADGDGQVNTFQIDLDGYTAYYKGVCSAGGPIYKPPHYNSYYRGHRVEL